jgi:hypothetical protein
MDRTERILSRFAITWSLFFLCWASVFAVVRILNGQWGWAAFQMFCGACHILWLRHWNRQLVADRRARQVTQ